jgi:hypothetical protein
MQTRWIKSDDSSQITALFDQIDSENAFSIFTTKEWLGTCSRAWPTNLGWSAFAFEDSGNGRIGTALIGHGLQVRHGLIRSRIRALNQSVSLPHDEIFIEMNGFGGVSRDQFGMRLEMLLDTLNLDPTWDEIRLPGLLPPELESALKSAKKNKLNTHVLDSKPTYLTNFAVVQELYAGNLYSAFSANTRQKLRRAKRNIETDIGPLKIEFAPNVQIAKSWFHSAGIFHRLRWRKTQDRNYGGFDNTQFVNFHRLLIEEHFQTGMIRLWRISAGSRIFAYLYNFRVQKKEFFYLSGIDYGIGEKYSPGLLAHVEAMQQCLDSGLSDYDFMAGKNRYKESLSTESSTQTWLVLQRPRVKFYIESSARQLRDRLFKAK